ncbi:unnamed protein product [Linum trigynum]|uniref:Uncharacterized protein n=1 Tax=Linum trigynum TaxID=586398 RepID=A0AAV2EJ75_9ROSI
MADFEGVNREVVSTTAIAAEIGQQLAPLLHRRQHLLHEYHVNAAILNNGHGNHHTQEYIHALRRVSFLLPKLHVVHQMILNLQQMVPHEVGLLQVQLPQVELPPNN